jgi:hypothetical protein
MIDSGFYYRWNPKKDEWDLTSMEKYNYDTLGNPLSRNGYNRDTTGNSWFLNYRYEKEYDSVDNLISEYSYFWDSNKNLWRGGQKSDYTYDSTGNQTSKIQLNWDTYYNDWIYYSKYTYAYDNYGNLMLETIYTWDYSDWKEFSQHETIFNPDGMLVSETYMSSYTEDRKYEYTYDQEGNKTSYSLYYDNNNWTLNSRGFYYWRRTLTDLPAVNEPKSNLILYPNPAVNGFKIKGLEGKATIDVLNNGGQFIFRTIPGEDEEINVNSLPGGIYFVKIVSSKGTEYIKLIRE